VTSRICGICPVAYQMSSCRAIESAAGVTVDAATSALRRLLYCGEWIESHVLHMLMLHAPDFFGLADAIEIAQRFPERVAAGLSIKQAGNALVRVLGGREVHPINVRVGGFYRLPSQRELGALTAPLTAALEEAELLLDWLGTLEFPAFTRDYELVSLQHPAEYPMNEGRLVSTAGLDISAEEWNAHFVEEQVAHSTALHARVRARGAYQVGPLARFVNNFERLGPRSAAAARRMRLDPSCRNPFRMLLVRGVEVVYALEEALRIIAAYTPPTAASVSVTPCAATGHAVTEAPRGILYHRYVLDADGLISEAQLTPPTSQNQRSIELDLQAMGGDLSSLPLDLATRRAEQAVRNYDPCISCSTHFVRLAAADHQ
jgi:coenzyme F420-reducing hydrogenase alpha subunit